MAFPAARGALVQRPITRHTLFVALAFISLARAFQHCGADADGHVTRGCGPECPERDSCTEKKLLEIGCAPCHLDEVPCCFGQIDGTATAISLGVCGALAVILTGSIMLMGWWNKPKGDSTILSGGH